jgi:hypothetical protein
MIVKVVVRAVVKAISVKGRENIPEDGPGQYSLIGLKQAPSWRRQGEHSRKSKLDAWVCSSVG